MSVEEEKRNYHGVTRKDVIEEFAKMCRALEIMGRANHNSEEVMQKAALKSLGIMNYLEDNLK